MAALQQCLGTANKMRLDSNKKAAKSSETIFLW